jgi:hypothetical protein
MAQILMMRISVLGKKTHELKFNFVIKKLAGIFELILNN